MYVAALCPVFTPAVMSDFRSYLDMDHGPPAPQMDWQMIDHPWNGPENKQVNWIMQNNKANVNWIIAKNIANILKWKKTLTQTNLNFYLQQEKNIYWHGLYLEDNLHSTFKIP